MIKFHVFAGVIRSAAIQQQSLLPPPRIQQGVVARFVAMPLGMQAVPDPSLCPAHSFVKICCETFSKAILPLPLIQEEQLSVIGERMYTKYW